MSPTRAHPLKQQTTFGKFDNIDMRVAQVLSAPLAEGTKFPCRVFDLDLGHLGRRKAVGQYALVSEDDLVGKNVVVCANLGPREIGPYTSEALVLGVPHPSSDPDENVALPLYASSLARPGDRVF